MKRRAFLRSLLSSFVVGPGLVDLALSQTASGLSVVEFHPTDKGIYQNAIKRDREKNGDLFLHRFPIQALKGFTL